MDTTLIDARALAALLGMNPRTLLDLASRGEIPSYRFGRCVRFDASEVQTAARRNAKLGVRARTLPSRRTSTPDERLAVADAAYAALIGQVAA
jgi:excisionase family DNA binding protein